VLASRLQFKIADEWWTWIDYEKFHELAQKFSESGGAQTFTSLDYVAKTPHWAVYGAPQKGFDPTDVRFRRKTKGNKDITGC